MHNIGAAGGVVGATPEGIGLKVKDTQQNNS